MIDENQHFVKIKIWIVCRLALEKKKHFSFYFPSRRVFAYPIIYFLKFIFDK